MRVVCVSDTHALHDQVLVPGGDVLVHAGDFTRMGSLDDIHAFNDWLGRQPHRHKVVIAGNHDFAFERDPAARALITHGHYLQDEEVILEGVKFWGSPWQPRFFDWAFNLDRGPALRQVWAKMPADTQILITHGPPHGILDRTRRGEAVGCEDLLARVAQVRPKLHIFGHIHEAYGEARDFGVHFVNASSCDLRYRAVQRPVVVDVAL